MKKKKNLCFHTFWSHPHKSRCLHFLTSVLKAHEGRSRKVGIRKRKAPLLDILYDLLTTGNKSKTHVFQAACVKARILKSEYIEYTGGN